jgi:hypothetical protein
MQPKLPRYAITSEENGGSNRLDDFGKPLEACLKGTNILCYAYDDDAFPMIMSSQHMYVTLVMLYFIKKEHPVLCL